MATLSTLQARKEALEKAMASGQQRIRFEGRGVQYQTIEQMQSALTLLERQIALTEGRRRNRQIRVNANKGFY